MGECCRTRDFAATIPGIYRPISLVGWQPPRRSAAQQAAWPRGRHGWRPRRCGHPRRRGWRPRRRGRQCARPRAGGDAPRADVVRRSGVSAPRAAGVTPRMSGVGGAAAARRRSAARPSRDKGRGGEGALRRGLRARRGRVAMARTRRRRWPHSRESSDRIPSIAKQLDPTGGYY